MANPEHVEILKKGVAEWNAWHDAYPWDANPQTEPDLPGNM